MHEEISAIVEGGFHSLIVGDIGKYALDIDKRFPAVHKGVQFLNQRKRKPLNEKEMDYEKEVLKVVPNAVLIFFPLSLYKWHIRLYTYEIPYAVSIAVANTETAAWENAFKNLKQKEQK